jgi:hypothetical protein
MNPVKHDKPPTVYCLFPLPRTACPYGENIPDDFVEQFRMSNFRTPEELALTGQQYRFLTKHFVDIHNLLMENWA